MSSSIRKRNKEPRKLPTLLHACRVSIFPWLWLIHRRRLPQPKIVSIKIQRRRNDSKMATYQHKRIKLKELGLTVSSMLKPFVHLISAPDDIEICLTGKEKVKPSSLCLPGAKQKPSPSLATNFASAWAIKSNRAWQNQHQILQLMLHPNQIHTINSRGEY